jgi:acyl carrier protein
MEEKVINLIARILGVDTSELDLDTEIGDLPEWDSMHHLTIIKELENLFDIKFEQGDLADCEDISDLVALIKDLNADR